MTMLHLAAAALMVLWGGKQKGERYIGQLVKWMLQTILSLSEVICKWRRLRIGNNIGGGGGSTTTLDSLLQVMHGDFRNFFLIIMCVIGKDAHI